MQDAVFPLRLLAWWTITLPPVALVLCVLWSVLMHYEKVMAMVKVIQISHHSELYPTSGHIHTLRDDRGAAFHLRCDWRFRVAEVHLDLQRGDHDRTQAGILLPTAGKPSGEI